MVHSYIADRMLAEFAAAAVVFARSINEYYDGKDSCDQGNTILTSELLQSHIEGVLQASHHKMFDYYSRCLSRGHRHFVWTGPKLEIMPWSADLDLVMPLTMKGEMLDLPSHSIYSVELRPPAPTPPVEVQAKRTRARGNSLHVSEANPKKWKR